MNTGLLKRFYNGECSEEEVQTVLEWFKDNTLKAKQEQDMHSLWQNSSQFETEEECSHDSKKLFNEIKEQIQEAQDLDHEEADNDTYFIPLQFPQYWFRIAAAVLLMVCLVWQLVQYGSRPNTVAVDIMSVEATPGVRKTIKLTDGSVIILNGGSKVTFRKSFAADKREVLLRGEAFFEVAKDSLRPFIVHSGKISTQALGTSFNISYSLKEDVIKVALATGAVKVNQQEKGQMRQLTLLKPGQQLSYSRGSQQYTVCGFNRTDVIGWKDGILYFKKADMQQIIKKLENFYGVAIEVDSSNLPDTAWNYTGEYNKEPLEKVLDGIGFVKDFTYSRTGNKVKIVFN